MRIPAFEVSNQRSIRLARCEAVPRLMVVAGPNGSGKSTLLHGIRSNGGYNNIVYVGPHRAMRKQVVQQRHLMAQAFSLETMLSSPNVAGVEGIRIFDGSRDPWGYDETSNYLKHALCQIEVDRHQAIATRVDRDGEIPRGSLVDPWKPLRELTANLLPHMVFERIDATNRDQVRVLFRVHRLATLVDIDELSSGEKSIVQMFYPLVEREIKARVRELEAGPQEVAERPELCVLIDEPELHLHPNLQIKVLDYLRVLTASLRAQVIVATHSPTIVEGATFDELFLLRPVELVQDGENQLTRVAQDEERLALLRSLFGSTHNLTSLQPVVIVEGAAHDAGGRAVADRRLYRGLHPGFDRVTLISGGGKGECVALARTLAPALAEFTRSLRVVALLDRDIDVQAGDLVALLPVSMIENFLLDPHVLFEAIESVRERTAFQTVEDVADALDRLLAEYEQQEVGRRAAVRLGSVHFHPPTDVDCVADAAATFVGTVSARYSVQAVADARGTADAAVADVRARQRRREEFDGKKILADFFRTHLHDSTLSRHVFAFAEREVEEVVMESTAQYWRPVWDALEQHWRPRRRTRDGAPRLAGTLHLAQAQSNRGPGGRKKDFPDAERLVKRLVAQELTLSFVPDAEQRLWRTVMRRKYQVTRNRVQLQNRLEALLEEAHIKVSSVVSDLLGISARRMLQALADGETDPAALATLAAPRLRATPAQLCDAFEACPTLHPVCRRLLKLTLEELRVIEDHLGQLDQQMADLLAAHHDAVQRLAEVPGLGVDSAQQVIAEVGATAATFPSPKHLASWMGACPGNEESAGVNYSHRCPKGNRQMRRVLNQAANAAVKAKGTIFAVVYRRLVPRLGHAQAIGAITHRLCRLIWKILHERVRYEERGLAVSAAATKIRARKMIRELRSLGYRVELLPAPSSSPA